MDEFLQSLAVAAAYAGPPLALLGAIGSSLGTAAAASAGLAVVAEDPTQRGRVMMLAALPMTQTFYGFIFMFLALLRLSAIPIEKITPSVGFLVLALGLVVGLIELFSAWYQGQVCRSAITMLIKTRGAIAGMGMILAVYIELFGILGMAFGIVALFTWVG